MTDLFRSILSAPGFKVSDANRRKVILAALLLLVALVAFTAYLLGHHAGLPLAADQPGWESTILATTIGFRARVALGLAGAVLIIAVVAWQVLDRGSLWQRLFHWDTAKDSGYTEASKTLGACWVFGCMVLGLFILAAAVLH